MPWHQATEGQTAAVVANLIFVSTSAGSPWPPRPHEQAFIGYGDDVHGGR